MGRDAFSVQGLIALVTGGAMGIGFGIARRFVEGGANVLIADVDEAAAGRAIRALGEGPGKVAACLVDVGAEDTGDRMVATCVRQFGGLDVLVNNAGIFPQVPMLKMTTELFDTVYRINLRGLAFAAKAAAVHMVQSGTSGSIVNIGSVDSLHPSMVGLAAYDASKGGVLMFTRSLALELAPAPHSRERDSSRGGADRGHVATARRRRHERGPVQDVHGAVREAAGADRAAWACRMTSRRWSSSSPPARRSSSPARRSWSTAGCCSREVARGALTGRPGAHCRSGVGARPNSAGSRSGVVGSPGFHTPPMMSLLERW